jgi:hypothetical protein
MSMAGCASAPSSAFKTWMSIGVGQYTSPPANTPRP